MPLASLFVRAARREPVERTPIWFMRQAGRMLPEYRALRERWSLLEISRQPELAVEVTLQPLRHMPLDAAILFADIMTPLLGAGVALDIVDGVGPVIEQPIRDAAGVAKLRPLVPADDVPHVIEALEALRRTLDPSRAVIGFAGAPFTLAAYLIEGRASREFIRTKTLMHASPEIWAGLMERLTDLTITYLRAQIEAGADAVQLFDSWVGALAPGDYARHVQPYTRRVFAALAPSGVPLIHFGTNTAALLEHMRTDGATVIGLDWRVPLDRGWATIGHDLAVQGNLDPATLLAPFAVTAEHARDVLRRAAARPGHIFNLGHGILPETPLDAAVRLVELVQTESVRLDGAEAAEPGRTR